MTDALPVLVTGAEGRVGRAVVAWLLAAGHPVTTLTLPGVTPHDGVRVVRGDARDVAAVAEAAQDVAAVVHLAAIPDPYQHPAAEVFGNNVLATFTVLWTAAEQGVRRFAIASSVNATGRPMNPHRPLPLRYPVDESVPLDLADPYSLSKQVDEHTLRTVCRRFGGAGVALRLPLMITAGDDNSTRVSAVDRLELSIADAWSWLDVRDAAEAFRLAITAELTGVHVLQLAAPETYAVQATEELLDRFAPGVARTRVFAGRAAAVDTTRAAEVLGFVPAFVDTVTDS